MEYEYENVQIVPFSNRSCREIEMHLISGGVIQVSLLDAQIFDMANGRLLVIEKVFDQGEIIESIANPAEEFQWKR